MKGWLLGLILVSQILAALPACTQAFYDYYVLALTWPNQYCSQNSCDKNWKGLWDGKSLIIHGFWPSSQDLAYLSCISENKYDPYCYRPFKFSQSQFSTKELTELNKYWPQLGSVKNFWAYEWNRHGTCYLHIIKDEYNSSLSDAQIFKRYFMDTVDRVKALNIKLTPGKVASKTQLANLLGGVHASQFYAICGDDNELDQIRICFDVYQEPGKEYLMTCPKSTDRNQCKFPMVIK